MHVKDDTRHWTTGVKAFSEVKGLRPGNQVKVGEHQGPFFHLNGERGQCLLEYASTFYDDRNDV